MIVFVISVWDIVRPLLLAARVIVYLQSKESIYFFSGLKTKLFSLDEYENNIVLAN